MQQRETQLDKLDSLEDIKLIVDEFPDLLQGADELQDIKTSLEEITRSADITADSAQKQLDAQIARVKASVEPKKITTGVELFDLFFSSEGAQDFSSSELIARVQKISSTVDKSSRFLDGYSSKINRYVLGFGEKDNRDSTLLLLVFLLVNYVNEADADKCQSRHLKLSLAEIYNTYYAKFNGELVFLSQNPDNHSLLNTFYARSNVEKQGEMKKNDGFAQAWKEQIGSGDQIEVTSLAEANATGSNIINSLFLLSRR